MSLHSSGSALRNFGIESDSAKRLFLLRDSLNRNQSAQKRLRGYIRRSKKPNRINAQSIAIDKAAPRTKSLRRFAHQGRQPVAYRLMERSAVPACDFANRTRAASGPALRYYDRIARSSLTGKGGGLKPFDLPGIRSPKLS
jgi:hypothetical protein